MDTVGLVLLVLAGSFGGGVALFSAAMYVRLASKRNKSRNISTAITRFGLAMVSIVTVEILLVPLEPRAFTPGLWAFLVGLLITAAGLTLQLFHTIKEVAEVEEDDPNHSLKMDTIQTERDVVQTERDVAQTEREQLNQAGRDR